MLLGEMLLQRPVSLSPRGGGGLLSDVLSLADAAYMQEMAAQRFDKITETLQQLPLQMLLVIRYVRR